MGAPNEHAEIAVPGQRPGGACCTARERYSLESRVRRAFALGWHVAQLYHASIPRDPDQPEPVEPRLAGLSGLNPASRYRLQLRMIEADIHATGLLRDAGTVAPSTVAIVATLETAGHTREQVSAGIYELHVALLEALTVADFRLGKSYGLGRALAETALIPASGTSEQRLAALGELLKPGRIQQVTRWLSALKSELPPHAAYATNRTLETWSSLEPDVLRADLPATVAALTAQGRVWRSLLVGEKSAVDMLNEGDYFRAAEALVVRSRRLLVNFLRHFWLPVLVALAVVAGVILWISYDTHLTSGSKFAAGIATAAAGLGVGVKSVSVAITRAAARLEGPLWQSELDESIAIAATRLPATATKPKRRSGDDVGELRPSHQP